MRTWTARLEAQCILLLTCASLGPYHPISSQIPLPPLLPCITAFLLALFCTRASRVPSWVVALDLWQQVSVVLHATTCENVIILACCDTPKQQTPQNSAGV